jgi:hypothetical protein
MGKPHNRMIVYSITRLTFVRKGKALAKHPDMRGRQVVETVKAVPTPLSAPQEATAPNLGRWRKNWG